MAISEPEQPRNSLCNNGAVYDYMDSFSSEVNDKGRSISSTDLVKAFFSSAPKWVRKLMALRDAVVGLAGLETSGSDGKRPRQLQNFRWEPSERIGPFKVFRKTNNDVILGRDDRHLNLRLSLCIEQVAHGPQKQLTISTVVKFNNFFGRVYFLAVRHRLIVSRMLNAIIKALEVNAENRLQDR